MLSTRQAELWFLWNVRTDLLFEIIRNIDELFTDYNLLLLETVWKQIPTYLKCPDEETDDETDEETDEETYEETDESIG